VIKIAAIEHAVVVWNFCHGALLVIVSRAARCKSLPAAGVNGVIVKAVTIMCFAITGAETLIPITVTMVIIARLYTLLV
jgi:hypothetical protein